MKTRGAGQELPSFAMDDCDYVGPVFNKVRAPLTLVLDNFSEIEHSNRCIRTLASTLSERMNPWCKWTPARTP
jgi:hypothetical protein